MINTSTQRLQIKNSTFIHYAYFFAAMLVLANNSLVADKSLIEYLSALIGSKPGAGFMDAFMLIGNIFVVPLLLFFFGITVYPSIHDSNPISFLKRRIGTLLPMFLLAAFVIMPISYYLLDKNYSIYGLHANFWHYLTHIYFKQWLIGPAWILPLVILFDLIIYLFFKFAHPLMQNLFSLVKSSKVYKLMVVFFLLSFIAFFLISDFTGSVAFFDIPMQHSSSWKHVGPFWWQENVTALYFIIYIFGVLLGGSSSFLDYIFTSKEELSKKWLNRLLEVIILYLSIKHIGNKTTLLGSALSVNIVVSFLSILLLFTTFSLFFSLLSKFAYKKSKILSSLSEHSLMIYTLHFLPLVIVKNYVSDFSNMTNAQKTYVIFIFTFFITLLICYLVVYIKNKIVKLRHGN